MAIEAKYFKTKDNKGVTCMLCPFLCHLGNGEYGKCNVRYNANGVLNTLTYSKITAINCDPIEKKPLYHFFPGSEILSVGSFGCNFTCQNCQNWEIAQIKPGTEPTTKPLSVQQIIEYLMQFKNRTIGLAYTYNEPILSIEYILQVAERVSNAGLKNVMVSNGFINPTPLADLLTFIDAFNIDLKGFSFKVYNDYLSAKLTPVLNTLKQIRKAGKHLEITFLLIPKVSDNEQDFKDMVQWIKDELGENTPLHISRYFPRYQLENTATDPKQLIHFYHIAKAKLTYVYIGNVTHEEGSTTHCASCHEVVIRRNGNKVVRTGLTKNGTCEKCHSKIVISN